MIVGCTAMPLTRCDVPSPLVIPPSGLYCPMLAWWIHPGRCFLAMPRPSGILPGFEGTHCVSIYAICVYETPQPSQFIVRIRYIFPVRHFPANANMMCFGGLVLPPVTAVGELFNYVKWLRIVSLPCQHCLQKFDDSFWDDVFFLFPIRQLCMIPH